MMKKKAFLGDLNRLVKKIIPDLYRICLDFSETSAVNHLLDTDDKGFIPVRFETACRSFREDDPDTARVVTDFYKDKICMASQRSIERLYMDKWHMAVYSYPPYPLDEETGDNTEESEVKVND